MKDRRLFWNSVLLCLPAMLLVAGGAWFLIEKTPEFEAQERSRVTSEYREMAVAAKADARGDSFDFKASGLNRGSLRIDKEPWGYADGEIWYIAGSEARRLKVGRVPEGSAVATLWWIFGGLSLGIMAITAYTVWRSVRFVHERDDFAAATVHDLTTPLVGLRRVIGIDDEEAANLVERMLAMVANLREFLASGARRRLPQHERIVVAAACREAYRTFAADYRDLIGEDVPIIMPAGLEEDALAVKADPMMLTQILWNLYANDLKYAAPYGKVRVEISLAGEMVAIEFVDEGLGLSARDRRKVFERYYRAKTIRESGKGGFGIGLSTARDFALRMGGEVSVAANSPRGCRFALRLPRWL